MICGVFGRYANRHNLLSAAERFLLEPTEAIARLDRIVECVRANWHSTFRRAGVSEADCQIVAGAFAYEGFFYHP